MEDSLKEIKRGNEQFTRQKALIYSLLDQIPSNKRVSIVFDNSVKYVLPFHWAGFSIVPTFSYRIDNLNQYSLIEKQYSKNIIRDINRAKKILTIDENDSDYNALIEMQNLTFNRQGRKNPINNKFTLKVIKSTIKAGHGKLFVARGNNGEVHAASFLLYDDRICFHLISGQNTEYGNDGAIPFLISKEIEYASKVSRIFDFEGSMVEGIEQVFKRFGGNQIINWQVMRQGFVGDLKELIKPRLKRMLGYKI